MSNNECIAPPKSAQGYYTTVAGKAWNRVPSVWIDDHRDSRILQQAFEEWTEVAGTTLFTFTTNRNEADIRCGFDYTAGSWSYLGTDAETIDLVDNTLNIGWPISNDYATALHEVAHSLSMGHEHQNPARGFTFNEPNVERILGGPPNLWSPQIVKEQVFDFWKSTLGSKPWDDESISHYLFIAAMVDSPEPYASNGVGGGAVLSQGDIEWVKLVYNRQVEEEVTEIVVIEEEIEPVIVEEGVFVVTSARQAASWDGQTPWRAVVNTQSVEGAPDAPDSDDPTLLESINEAMRLRWNEILNNSNKNEIEVEDKSVLLGQEGSQGK